MREIKFRAWDKRQKQMSTPFTLTELTQYEHIFEVKFKYLAKFNDLIWLQYTGLKDKETLTDIYEGDIIDMDGKIRGNIYESPEVYKALSTSVVAGMGYEDWENTKQRLVRQGKLIAEQPNLPTLALGWSGRQIRM